jgi:hypothetical protein
MNRECIILKKKKSLTHTIFTITIFVAAAVASLSLLSCNQPSQKPSGAAAQTPKKEFYSPDSSIVCTYDNFFSGWLGNLYDYFDNQAGEITINDSSYGTFPRGVSRAIGYSADEFDSLTGMHTFLEQTGDDTLPFQKVNPLFIAWAHSTLIPDPSLPFAGYTYQCVYDACFQRFFRLMTHCYLLLQNDLKAPEEIAAYREQFTQNGSFDAVQYLIERYSSRDINDSDFFYYTVPEAIGFWMRRSMDGSADELWKGLSKLMALYDDSWFQRRLKNLVAVQDTLHFTVLGLKEGCKREIASSPFRGFIQKVLYEPKNDSNRISGEKHRSFVALKPLTPYVFKEHVHEMAIAVLGTPLPFISSGAVAACGPMPECGAALWDSLVQQKDFRFNRQLDYYAFGCMGGKTEFAWKKTALKPHLQFYIDYMSDDDSNAIHSEIQFAAEDSLFHPAFFVGIQNGKPPLTVSFASTLLSTVQRKKIPGADMVLCRAWSLPKTEDVIKSLFTVDFCIFSNPGGNEPEPFGGDNGVYVYGRSVKDLGLDSTFCDSIITGLPQKRLALINKSILYAVTDTGDTIALYTDAFKEHSFDGDVDLISADAGYPVFTDIDGDRQQDIIVNGRGIIVRNNGRLVLREFD